MLASWGLWRGSRGGLVLNSHSLLMGAMLAPHPTREHLHESIRPMSTKWLASTKYEEPPREP